MSGTESVNENTAGPSTDSITVGPGESFANFDELESAQASNSRSRQFETVHDKKPAPKVAKSAEENGEADAKRYEPKREAAEKAETKEKVEAKGVEQQQQAKAPPAKLIKIKNGDTETELPGSVSIPVKVDGKEIEVTLEQLRSDYSGKKSWSSELGKLGADKQKFKAERDTVIGKLGEMFEASKTNPINGLMKMAEMAGMDPFQYRQDFLAALHPMLEKRLEMSDSELRAADAEAEVAFYRHETQSRTKKETDEREFKSYESQTLQKVQQSGIDAKTFEQTYLDLERLVKNGEYRTESGFVTPDDVIQVAVTSQKYETAESAMTELSVNLSTEQKQKFFADFIPLAVAQKLNAAEIKEVVQETFKDMRASSLSKKLRKSQPEQVAQASRSTPRNPSVEPTTFDDL